MANQWQGSVFINAPVAEVYRFLADFARHAEWDHSVTRMEVIEPGDASGVGARWRTYEVLHSLLNDRFRRPLLQGSVGITMREVRELVPNQRVSWHAHPVPKMGISSDCAFNLVEENGGTRLTETVTINAPSVMLSVGNFVFRDLDEKFAAQWNANLEAIQAICEGHPAPERSAAVVS